MHVAGSNLAFLNSVFACFSVTCTRTPTTSKAIPPIPLIETQQDWACIFTTLSKLLP
eukprot:jgi/Botrbrau1/7688/Bobra.0159s0126.1